jgi:hypothetical protein
MMFPAETQALGELVYWMQIVCNLHSRLPLDTVAVALAVATLVRDVFGGDAAAALETVQRTRQDARCTGLFIRQYRRALAVVAQFDEVAP